MSQAVGTIAIFGFPSIVRSDNMENLKGGIRKRMFEGNVLRLLLVDDHAVVRKGLGLLLGMDMRFEVVAEVERGDGVDEANVG